ncbi:TlpA family protein disulfide reductase [Pedobacter sp. KLB.chiD]|uniref:TlpA family protein disulfide reductase n=1 Tax=Pedobacter sp. KLB.chiD TaxID=3387402 RepID=UPI0039995CAE
MNIFFRVFLIQLFLINSISAKVFQITGRITGKENLKFAYAFNSIDDSLIQIVPIVNNAFILKGEISDYNRFGALPTINVLLIPDSLSVNEIERRRMISKRKHYNCTVIAEEKIFLTYDTDAKVFTIKAKGQNFVQNLYLNRLSLYRNTRDSLFKSIRMTNESNDTKNDKIDRLGAELFTSAMRDFIKLVKAYPDEVSLLNFSSIVYDKGISGKEVLEAFSLFPKEVRNSQYGRNLYQDISDKLKMEELMAEPAYVVGQTFPKFILPDANGVKQSGDELLGKYTLVDFWATWCGPCRAEIPNVVNAYKHFHNKGFNVITISLDAEKDKEKWLKAISDDKMQMLSNLFNGDDFSGLARTLKVVAIPMNFLLDAQGKIVATNLRGEQLRKKLEEFPGE